MTIRALYGAGSDSVKLPPGISAIGAIWFLPALLWALIIVKYAISVKYGFIFIFFNVIVSYIFSKYIWLPLSIQAGGVAALVIEYEYGISLSITRNYYAYGLVSFVGAVLICYTVLCIAKLFENIEILLRILCFHGENSLIILCFHLMEMGYFPWYKIYETLSYFQFSLPVFHMIVWTGKVLFCTLCVWCVYKSKALRKIFGRK